MAEAGIDANQGPGIIQWYTGTGIKIVVVLLVAIPSVLTDRYPVRRQAIDTASIKSMATQQPLLIEHGFLLQHDIHRSAELVREDRQSFSLIMLIGFSLQPGLRLWIPPEQ